MSLPGTQQYLRGPLCATHQPASPPTSRNHSVVDSHRGAITHTSSRREAITQVALAQQTQQMQALVAARNAYVRLFPHYQLRRQARSGRLSSPGSPQSDEEGHSVSPSASASTPRHHSLHPAELAALRPPSTPPATAAAAAACRRQPLVQRSESGFVRHHPSRCGRAPMQRAHSVQLRKRSHAEMLWHVLFLFRFGASQVHEIL